MQASAGGCPKPGGRPQPWPSSAPAPAGAGSAREVRLLLAIVLGGGCTFLLCICLHLHLFHLHLLLLPLLLLPLLLRALSFAAGLRAQPVGGAVELLGDHTQELCLVLTTVVIGGADVHQLEAWRREKDDRGSWEQ